MAQQPQHSKKATTRKQTTAKKAAPKGPAVEHLEEQPTTPEDRHRTIAEAAYLIAEGRGFQCEMALDDWLQAEAEVDAQFAARH